MYFQVYDAIGRLRSFGDNWAMARSVLDQLISEGEKTGCCPHLVILPEHGYEDDEPDEEAPNG